MAEDAPLPQVIVTISEGPARVAVPGLTILFEIAEGAGEVTRTAQTTDFGQASASLLDPLSFGSRLVVRAWVAAAVYQDTVDIGVQPIDFVYEPPAVSIGR